MRRQLEECDAIQGVQQALTTFEGGWGGLGTSLLAEMQEECRNRPITCFGLLRAATARAAPGCRAPSMGYGPRGGGSGGGGGRARLAVNLALSLCGLQEACRLSCILDEEACASVSQDMVVDPHKPYHTSAVLASTIDAVTSPIRFSCMGMDAWASGGGPRGWEVGGGGGQHPQGWGGGPPCLVGMKFASAFTWIPFPIPRASVSQLRETLLQSAHQGGTAYLGPSSGRRKSLPGSRGMGVGAGAGLGQVVMSPRVFSRLLVARGLGCPVDDQVSLMDEVFLAQPGVGAGASVGIATPLPLPLSFPMLFRDTVGPLGESPLLLSGQWGGGAAGGKGFGGGGAGHNCRVMCKQVSMLAGVERSSRLSTFFDEVSNGLDLSSGSVLLELEKNGLHRDDAWETKEALANLTSTYSQ
ncbi:unnamed protein product [Discosporangium mesarthrocarpum]